MRAPARTFLLLLAPALLGACRGGVKARLARGAAPAVAAAASAAAPAIAGRIEYYKISDG